MSYFSASSFGPVATPRTIKRLIGATCILSILCAGAQEVFELFQLFPGPQYLLSLSWWGLSKWYVWQPLSFFFVQDFGFGGLSFSFFLWLFINMYILWIIGTNLVQALGTKPFLRLYFLGGLGAAAVALLSMLVTGQYEMITGTTPSLLALATVWVMAFPETEVLLFFLIPFKAKWIVIAAIGILLLNALLHWNLTFFILYVAAIAIGYGYALLARGWTSPFPETRRLDAWLSRWGSNVWKRAPRWMRSESAGKSAPRDNVIDITSGEPIKNDDAFVDAMLAKISKYGEDSLTWAEKRRLQSISERKMRDRH